MPLAPEEEAKQLLRNMAVNVRTRPGSDVVEAVWRSNVPALLQHLTQLGIPLGSPLGQALLRLAQP